MEVIIGLKEKGPKHLYDVVDKVMIYHHKNGDGGVHVYFPGMVAGDGDEHPTYNIKDVTSVEVRRE